MINIMLEKRIPEFIDDLRNIPCAKSGKPCKINDPGFNRFACYLIYAFPISNKAYIEMMSMSTKNDPIYIAISSFTKDSRAIFVNTNQYVPAIQFLNKKYNQYHFFLFYSTKPHSFMANNKSIYIAVKPESELLFNIAKEDSIMYNDDVNMILESAYADGYYQAMTDMDKGHLSKNASKNNYGGIAEEDANIFDENYFNLRGTEIEPFGAMESASDVVFSKSDFSYMPKNEAEKAYRGTIGRLLKTDYVTNSSWSGKNISANTDRITKGDFGILYGISDFKALINKINRIHSVRYDNAKEFLDDVDDIIRRYDRNKEMQTKMTHDSVNTAYNAIKIKQAIDASNQHTH